MSPTILDSTYKWAHPMFVFPRDLFFFLLLLLQSTLSYLWRNHPIVQKRFCSVFRILGPSQWERKGNGQLLPSCLNTVSTFVWKDFPTIFFQKMCQRGLRGGGSKVEQLR
jgi:hypothetical protein